MNSAELLSWVVTAIVLPGLGVVLRVGMPPALEWLRASIRSRDAGRLAESFVAGAGRIALDVVTARQAGPNVDIRRIVADGVKREGADIVGNIMKDTAAKLGVSRADAEKAVAGRLGPILGVVSAEIPGAVEIERGGSGGDASVEVLWPGGGGGGGGSTTLGSLRMAIGGSGS